MHLRSLSLRNYRVYRSVDLEFPDGLIGIYGANGSGKTTIIESLRLRRPIYKKTAAYGHFGRPDADFSWEATDKADGIRSDAGLSKTDSQPVHATTR